MRLRNPKSVRRRHRLRAILPVIAALGLGALMGCRSLVNQELVAERTSRLYGDAAEHSTTPTETQEPAAPSFGEDAGLDDYLRFGLAHNAGLRAAFERWRAALERVPQVTSLPDPRLSWTHFIEDVQTRTGPQQNRFSVSQTFPWFGKRGTRGEIEVRHAESLWWRVEAQRLMVIRDIKRAYMEYAYLAQAIGITEDNLRLLQRLEPIVQRRVQTGASQGDLLRLQLEIGKVDNELETLRGFRSALNGRLNAVLNRDGGEPLPWPSPPEAPIDEVSADDLRQRLVESNPELEGLRWTILQEEERIKLARLEGYPDVTIGFDYFDTGEAERTTMPAAGGGMTRTSPPGSGEDPYAISLSFNVPIWRNKYSAAVRQAEAAHAAAEEEIKQKRHDFTAELEMRLYELDDARRRISLYRDTLIPRGRQALQVLQGAYRTATASILDVIDSQRELLAFELAYWRAASNYEQRLADLEALCGGTIQ